MLDPFPAMSRPEFRAGVSTQTNAQQAIQLFGYQSNHPTFLDILGGTQETK
jgi:hypothetical protein